MVEAVITLTGKESDLNHKQITEHSIRLIFDKLTAKEPQLYHLLKKVRDTTRDLLGLDYRAPFFIRVTAVLSSKLK